MTASPVETIISALFGTAAFMKGVSASARTGQTLGIEGADYLKVSFEQASTAAGQIARAGSLARAMELQSAFLMASAEQMMERAATFRDLCATLARDIGKPFAATPALATSLTLRPFAHLGLPHPA